MSERQYDQITVQDVIDRADVGRSTFYAHYSSKEALLNASLGELRTVLTSPNEQPLGFSLPLLRHIEQHRALGQALFGSAQHTPVAQRIMSLLEEAIRQDLLQARLTQLPLPLDGFTKYAAGAYLAIVQWWLQAAEPMQPVELDRLMRRLILAATHP
ncbi:TetR/AcrR family transcriptional regulator [Catellatospora sichuanensis]|uniref:TetR/AcrR family transcriptional regulator n=1 Tax=Catellatospora sichuanensis TaxID=1969805 RepID=UPI001C923A4D|nr:TetR/AcrR family transcriptional regulator [Catellatospora sichuanensis]